MINYENWASEVDESPECLECEKKNKKLEIIGHYFEGVLEEIYSKKELDHSSLEYCLDNLCYYLDINMEFGEMQIARKGKTFTKVGKINP